MIVCWQVQQCRSEPTELCERRGHGCFRGKLSPSWTSWIEVPPWRSRSLMAEFDPLRPTSVHRTSRDNVDLSRRRGAILIPRRPFSESHRRWIQPMAGARFEGRFPCYVRLPPRYAVLTSSLSQRLGLALDDQPAGLQHVAAICHRERHMGILLHQQHRRALPADIGDDAVNLAAQ
jgi:hypothetical protein